MEIPESNPWNPTNLLLFFGGVIVIVLFVLYLIFPNLLGLEEEKETEPQSQTTETVIAESVITPLYSPDPFNLDDKSRVEIKDIHSQLELLSQRYKDLPHADEFAIKAEIDSVMRVAEERLDIRP